MGKQSQWQVARRTARDARNERQRERQEREKRLEDLAVTALVAVGKIAECERSAGEALRAMTEDEGLTLGEAVEWCGAEFGLREATRLRRLAGSGEHTDDHTVETDDSETRGDDLAPGGGGAEDGEVAGAPATVTPAKVSA